MPNEVRTLILVFKDKDELYSNLLRKLVDTKDDNQDTGEVVGTEDGSVEIVAWNEKQWLANKGTISSKVLFLGEVKDADKLIPIIDVKYNKFGITYGWAGNQAVIYADPKALKSREDYNAFLDKLKQQKNNIEISEKQKKLGFNVRTVLKGAGTLFLPFVWPFLAGSLIKVFDDKKLVKNQQYTFGIFELYKNDLETFMKE